MEKIRLKDIKLSEEIKKGRTKVDYKKYLSKIDVFAFKVVYNEFRIFLVHPIPPKKIEDNFYKKSKYGWWMYCAKKEEIDSWDKKLLEKPCSYGQYKESAHDFCSDNMHDDKYFYSLHPNEMVNIVKKSIDKFYNDKETLKNEKT